MHRLSRSEGSLGGLWLVSMLNACSTDKQTVATTAALAAAAETTTAETETEGELTFTAETYTGVGKGFSGDITVEVTVDEKNIQEVKVISHTDSAGVSDGAFDKMPGLIVENQSLAVDTVAGCTMSSKGIIEAVENALKDNCNDPSLLMKEVAAAQGSGELIEKTADVVIIGAGGTGMSAAVEAINAGSSVIVLEKMPSPGGNTILAGSTYNAADPERQKAYTMNDGEKERIEEIIKLEPKNEMMKSWQEWDDYKAGNENYFFDSPSLHKLQTYMDGDYVGDPVLIDVLGDHALEGIEFLSGFGANWIDGVNAAVGVTWQRSHPPTMNLGTKGAAFVMPQVNYVTEKGGEIILEAKARPAF